MVGHAYGNCAWAGCIDRRPAAKCVQNSAEEGVCRVSIHQPAKAASRPKSMPAFAGASSGLAATSCCVGERLATRLSTAPPRRRSAGRVSLHAERWRSCAHTGLLPVAGARVHEGAGLLGGGAGGECEDSDDTKHFSESEVAKDARDEIRGLVFRH